MISIQVLGSQNQCLPISTSALIFEIRSRYSYPGPSIAIPLGPSYGSAISSLQTFKYHLYLCQSHFHLKPLDQQKLVAGEIAHSLHSFHPVLIFSNSEWLNLYFSSDREEPTRLLQTLNHQGISLSKISRLQIKLHPECRTPPRS